VEGLALFGAFKQAVLYEVCEALFVGEFIARAGVYGEAKVAHLPIFGGLVYDAEAVWKGVLEKFHGRAKIRASKCISRKLYNGCAARRNAKKYQNFHRPAFAK
jgi:hypothetical protein